MAHIQNKTYTSRKTGKTSTVWQARYTAPDGRERTQRFGRQVDAETWLNVSGADIARGAWVDPMAGRVTFKTYAAEWKSTKADVSARTLINIESRLDNHAIPYFGDMQLSSVRPAHVRGFVAELTASGLSPSTVSAIYRTSAQVFGQAASDEIIAKTPCRDVKLPKQGQTDEMHFLTPEQVNELAAVIDPRYRTLVYNAAYAGLRAGELAALRFDSLALGELGGSIIVTGAASEVRGVFTPGPTKTGKKRRVAIPHFLADMLRDHLEAYLSSEGYVFSAAEGGPVRHRNFYRRHFRPAVKRARELAIADEREDEAIPEDLRFHDLRTPVLPS